MKRLRGTIEARRQDILGLEGKAARSYFEAISSIMPERYRFAGRSRNPARDEFNALLNYGYGVLYSLGLNVILQKTRYTTTDLNGIGGN